MRRFSLSRGISRGTAHNGQGLILIRPAPRKVLSILGVEIDTEDINSNDNMFATVQTTSWEQDHAADDGVPTGTDVKAFVLDMGPNIVAPGAELASVLEAVTAEPDPTFVGIYQRKGFASTAGLFLDYLDNPIQVVGSADVEDVGQAFEVILGGIAATTAFNYRILLEV